MKARLILFTLTVSWVVLAWGQTAEREMLVETIETEYPIIFSKKYDRSSSKLLKIKFEEAQVYLRNELEKYTLVDASTFFEDVQEEMIELEKQKANESVSPSEVNVKLEQTYLLLSAIKPQKSDSLFFKLISSYVNEQPNLNEQDKIDAVLWYKSWLYHLLLNRFGKDTDAYKHNNSALFINRIVSNYMRPFKGIDAEKEFIKKLTRYARAGTEYKSSYTFEELIKIVYQHRITRVEDAFSKNRTDELFHFIEKLYEQAIEITNGDTDLKHNLGVFYNSEAVFLAKLDDTTLGKREVKKKEKRIKELATKAEEFLFANEK